MINKKASQVGSAPPTCGFGVGESISGPLSLLEGGVEYPGGFRYPPKNEHGTRDTYPIPRTWDQEPGRDLAPDTRHTLSPFPGEHL